MVYLVDEYRERGQLTDEMTQLIRLPVLFVVAILEQINLAVFLLYAVEDDLLGIGDGHEAEQRLEWLVIRDFLDVGILGAIGFAR